MLIKYAAFLVIIFHVWHNIVASSPTYLIPDGGSDENLNDYATDDSSYVDNVLVRHRRLKPSSAISGSGANRFRNCYFSPGQCRYVYRNFRFMKNKK